MIQRLMTCRRAVRYLWSLPTTAAGLVFFMLAIFTGGKSRVVDGVLEVWGGAVTLFLERCTLLEGGAGAMTLGHVVLGRTERLLNLTRSHERVHVRQCERWGPLFLPAYAIASLIALARGKRAYEDNCFEREAYALPADSDRQ